MIYLLRAIPDDLWARVKARAARDGHTIRWILLRLLTAYVSGTPDPPTKRGF